MKKIPTLFLRDPENPKYVTQEINPDASWVIDEQGYATRKYDGTCVMYDEWECWWARREVKPGKKPPENYVPVSTDPNTRKTAGWEPIWQSSFARYHAQALESDWNHRQESSEHISPWSPGTYELIGPKIQGNPEHVDKHLLVFHALADPVPAPRDFPVW